MLLQLIEAYLLEILQMLWGNIISKSKSYLVKVISGQ